MPVRITRDTYDQMAESWAKTHNSDMKFYAKQYRIFRQYCRNGGLVLDAGCGNGIHTDYFLKKKYKVIGIDYSNGMLKEAKKLVPNGDFYQMDMRHLGFLDSSFDGIFCESSFFHIPKAEAGNVLREFNRVLKKDGIFYVMTMRGSGEIFQTGKPELKRFYAAQQPEEFDELLMAAGFKIFRRTIRRKSHGKLFLRRFCTK